MALRLKKRGITRVRPLEGGVNRWLELRFPVDKLSVPVAAPPSAAPP